MDGDISYRIDASNIGGCQFTQGGGRRSVKGVILAVLPSADSSRSFNEVLADLVVLQVLRLVAGYAFPAVNGNNLFAVVLEFEPALT